MPALISSCLAAGALVTLSALVNVTAHTCQCASTQPIFTSHNGNVHHHCKGWRTLWERIWTLSLVLKEEDTIPCLHLPNIEMHYADLEVTGSVSTGRKPG